jgi:hypothetical protein
MTAKKKTAMLIRPTDLKIFEDINGMIFSHRRDKKEPPFGGS